MSADIRQAHRWPPEATICSRNSGTSGTSSVGDRLLQLRGGHRGHPGQPAQPLGHVGGGVAEHRELQVAHRLLADHVEAPEGEEQVGLDALAEGGVGQDQARVGHVEVALGADDGELAALALRVVEVGDDGGGCGAAVVVMAGLLVAGWSWWSDAAVRLGQARDVGHLLGRLLREQGEQLLDGDAAAGGDAAQGRGLAGLGEVGAQEAEDLPVLVGQGDADLGGQGGGELLVPLVGDR